MPKKYFISTYGCQMNKSDSVRISSFLCELGYIPTHTENEADLIVVNACSVRQSAIDRIHGQSRSFGRLKHSNPNLITILTGCLLKKDKRFFKEKFDYVLNSKEIKAWKQTLNVKRKPGRKSAPMEYLAASDKERSAFIPISNGCNNFCTYCVVPMTRGKLVCRGKNEIMTDVRKAVQIGKKDIWLLGQNVNDYAAKEGSRKVNFADLLKTVNALPGNFRIFFTSPNPKNFSNELIETMMQSAKVARFLNLPVQSGDNEILKKMKRPYTVEQYKDLVARIRSKMPNINLSTDAIVGFPGETKKQFQNTAELFKEIGFDIAYISKYSPRRETAAFKLDNDVPLQEKKRREKILRSLTKNG